MSNLKSFSLDAAVLLALNSFSAYCCGTVSMGRAPLPALRSVQLEHTSASLDPSLLPQLQSLKLGPSDGQGLSLSIPGASAFSALRSLHFSQGSAALLSELLQSAPALAELTVHLPGGFGPSLASNHFQVCRA